jgi:hypothetical protein
MKHSWIMICFVALAFNGALAQEKKTVPPPPKPVDDGPSLEATMKFIQDKLNDIGPVNYMAYSHDNATGNDRTDQWKYEANKVVADAGGCRIDYHWKTEFRGAVAGEGDGWFSLKAVRDVVVMPIEQDMKENYTASGHPGLSSKVDPPVFVLKERGQDKKFNNYFDFFDEDMANRVAKAMVHAVELCGGGSKPEPF